VVLLALLAAMLSCERAPHPGAPAETAPSPRRTVRTAAVETIADGGPVVSATIVARRRASLASRMAATVIELPFEQGEAVRSGEVVVRLDDEALHSRLRATEAALVTALADRDRMEHLLERDAATPRETEAARARAVAAEAEVDAGRDALRYASLRAPFTGLLTRRLVREGDVVSPGQALVEIEGAGGYELRAAVDAAAAAAIAPGAALTVQVDGVAGAVAATVRAVTPAGDPATHRFEVVADLAAVAGLRSGLYGRLLLPAPGTTDGGDGLTIPIGASFTRGGLVGVFVVEDGVARLRWIAAGRREGERLAVRAGLEAGERVVLDPAGLGDGDAVTEQR
jgi:RND family efflux transporter MFP subunit